MQVGCYKARGMRHARLLEPALFAGFWRGAGVLIDIGRAEPSGPKCKAGVPARYLLIAAGDVGPARRGECGLVHTADLNGSIGLLWNKWEQKAVLAVTTVIDPPTR